MQLEKATSANTEAGLAGWISSNDVTLFTMVLVVIVALFLHAKLIRGQDENKLLVIKRNELTEVLEDRDQELEKKKLDLEAKSRDLEKQSLDLEEKKLDLDEKTQALQETRGDLKVSEDEQVVLKQELLKAMKDIDVLTKDIASLGQIRLGLQKEKTQFFERGTELDKQVKSLESDKKGLEDEKKSLSERMADLATKLDDRLKALADLEKQRALLQGQTEELDTIVDTLKKKLAASGTEIDAMAVKAGETEAAYQKRIAALEKSAGNETKRAEDYLARLRRAADLFQGLKKSNTTLEQKLDGAEQRYQRQLTLETTVNRKLVGLNGKLKRVGILFDASGSMKQKDEQAGGDRWQEAQNIASTWLGHLDVDECVLIVFSSDVRTFPNDGTMSRIQGPEGDANRAKLMEQLKSVEPEGWTNTLDALKTAYAYKDIDTILLFSDGAPTFANSGRFDPNVAEQIYALCRKHPDVPINTVGLGNYFDQNLSTFLRTVANVSGGTFRGR